MRGLVIGRPITAVAVALALAGDAGAAPDPAASPAGRVVVWPRTPADDVAGVDAAVVQAGRTPVEFDPLRARLIAHGERATAAEAEVLDAVQAGLAVARAAYLRQDFTAMADTLAELEARGLAVLAQPRQRAVLWELELQRGLAELARGAPDAARARFMLALALDDTRAPRRDLYGPAVVHAFTEAADARAATPARQTALRITPGDARIALDGLAVIDPAAPRDLRPGLHVVIASAPGHARRAALIELGAGQPIALALPAASGDAVDQIADAWAAGELDAGTAGGRRAILAAAATLAAPTALVIAGDPAHGAATAQWITGVAAAPVVHGATPALAAAAALEPRAGPLPTPAPSPASRSVLRSPWLWAGVAVAAAAAIVTGLALESGEHTLRILPPAP